MLKESMKEIKFKGKIDSSVKSKRKLLKTIGDKLIIALGIDKIKIGNKHLEFRKFIYYENAYKELTRISETQLTSIDNIPDKINGFSQEFNLLDYSKYISENYFKCKSPIENDEIVSEMFSYI